MRAALSIAAVLSFGAVAVNAQQGADVLLLSVHPAMDHLTTKRVYEVVQGFDPNGKVTMEADHIELQLAADVPVGELIDALNALGPVHFDKFTSGALTERMTPGSLPDDFPQYTDTGDPEADEAAYAVAKQQWLQAHPEYYNRPLRKPVK
jgi:hypothetical protein